MTEHSAPVAVRDNVFNRPIEGGSIGSRLAPGDDFLNQRHWLGRMPNRKASRYNVSSQSLPVAILARLATRAGKRHTKVQSAQA